MESLSFSTVRVELAPGHSVPCGLYPFEPLLVVEDWSQQDNFDGPAKEGMIPMDQMVWALKIFSPNFAVSFHHIVKYHHIVLGTNNANAVVLEVPGNVP